MDRVDPASDRTLDDLIVRGISKSFPGSGTVLDDVTVTVPSGTSLALLGPSGCGKTTLLRVIAGLEQPDAGSVQLGDRILVDAERSVPPEKRRIGMVFQNWALFSHLSVARNVGFGLPRSERKSSDRIDEALAMVGLESFADRSTETLSGGQQQRVALARALAPRPEVLFFDEPFSNLDATLRSSVRSEVRALLAQLAVTSIFVTHDQEEAFVLGDQIAVMNGGRVVQVGDPVEIYERPVDRWVASFVGEANIVSAAGPVTAEPGDGAGAHVDTPFGRAGIGSYRSGPSAGDEVELLVRPEQFRLAPVPENHRRSGSVESGTVATVSACEYLGHSTRYLLDWNDHELIAREPSRPRFVKGEAVEVTLGDGPFRPFGIS